MEDYKNNTRVVFDNNLKICIMNIPSRLKNQLKSMDYITLQDAQKEIREYFIANQREFNIAGKLTNSYENCPDFYALLSAVSSDITICDTWNEVYNQFALSLKHNETLYDASNNYITCNNLSLCNYEEDMNIKTRIVCMCGHLCCPENMSIVTNMYTGLKVLIACDCLEKTEIINRYNFVTKIKKNDVYSKILIRKKLESEKKKEIQNNNANRWETIIKKYMLKLGTYRVCIECRVLSILALEPDWKKKCMNCYMKPSSGVCLLKMKKPIRETQ